MPTLSDIALFLSGQAFGQPSLPPNTDLTGQTILVTGTNSGLGLDASKHLARMNVSRLILACRDVHKGEEARTEILAVSGRKDLEAEVWEVDLADYGSVAAFSARVRESLDRLDAVIANAGVELTSFSLSEGLERTLTVNVVSTYLLCLGVLPKLASTSREFGVQTRLTLVGSMIHHFGDDSQLHAIPSDQNIFQALSDSDIVKMPSRYPLSKLLQHLIFTQLIRHISTNTATINLINPGWCGTGLSRNKQMSIFERASFTLLGRTSEQGSRTLVHGICAGRETHGKYLSECHEQRQSTYVSSEKGQEMAGKVWEEVLEIVREIDPAVLECLD